LIGRYQPLDNNGSDLRSGVNDKGDAQISPYWSIWFLKGTKEQQQKELDLHRMNPKYEKPPWEAPNWEDDYVIYINGGCIELVYERLEEEEATEPLKLE